MIGDYVVAVVTFGIVVSYVVILHRYWLRDVFNEGTRKRKPATTHQSTSEIPIERTTVP